MTSFDKLLGRESIEEEITRLASYPEGSDERWLAGVPVDVGLVFPCDIIVTPERPNHHGRMIVLIMEEIGDTITDEEKLGYRYPGSWRCKVLYNEDPDSPYQPGSPGSRQYDITVSATELARGQLADLSKCL